MLLTFVFWTVGNDYKCANKDIIVQQLCVDDKATYAPENLDSKNSTCVFNFLPVIEATVARRNHIFYSRASYRLIFRLHTHSEISSDIWWCYLLNYIWWLTWNTSVGIQCPGGHGDNTIPWRRNPSQYYRSIFCVCLFARILFQDGHFEGS